MATVLVLFIVFFLSTVSYAEEGPEIKDTGFRLLLE